MIRKKTRPVSVCTGRGKKIMRNEARDLFKASFLKPDVRVVEDRYVDKKGPRKYRVIPLHKHIHVVSAADINAHKERERLKQGEIKDQKKGEEAGISYLSSLPEEVIALATVDEKAKNANETGKNAPEHRNNDSDGGDKVKHLPAFYCKEGEKSEVKVMEEKKTDQQSSGNDSLIIDASPPAKLKKKKKKKKKKDKQGKNDEELDQRDQEADDKRDKERKSSKKASKKDRDKEEKSKDIEKMETKLSKRELSSEVTPPKKDEEAAILSKRSTRNTSKQLAEHEEEENEELEKDEEQKRK